MMDDVRSSMKDVGAKMHELIITAKARELIKVMESTSEGLGKIPPVLREAALLDALSVMENEPSAKPMAQEIVRKARAIIFERSTLRN